MLPCPAIADGGLVRRRLSLTTACVLLSSAFWGCARPGTGAPQVDASPKPAAPMLQQVLDPSSPALRQLTEADLPVLRRYLAASAGWKLTPQGNRVVAIRREPADETTSDSGKLRITPDGWYFKHQPWRRYQTMICFGDAPPVDEEWKPIRSEAAASSRSVTLLVAPAVLPDYRSYLVVRGKAPVSLEIKEESMDTLRDSTRRLLREVSEELAKVVAGAEQIRKQGFLPGAAPKESVTTGPAVLKVASAEAPGAFHLLGYVNPGAAGTISAQLFDSSGKPLVPELVRDQSQELTGWSTDPQRKFFFNSQVRLPAGTPAPVRAQLWFQPEGRAAAKKLLETRVGGSR